MEGSFLREAPAAPCANFRVERLERRMAKTMQLAVHPGVDVDVGPHVVGALRIPLAFMMHERKP